MFGGSGADKLTAGVKAAVLYGRGGNDTLTGGKGKDYLDGGEASDTARRVGARRPRRLLPHRVTRLHVVVTGDTHLGPRRRGPLPAALLAACAGADRILHTGDVTDVALLDELAALAPLDGVAGNCDGWDVAARLPAEQTVEIGGAARRARARPGPGARSPRAPARALPGRARRLLRPHAPARVRRPRRPAAAQSGLADRAPARARGTPTPS